MTATNNVFIFNNSTTLSQALYYYLKKLYSNMSYNATKFKEEHNSVERLHDFRTSIRRMRVIIQDFVEPILSKKANELNEMLSFLQRNTNKCRDFEMLYRYVKENCETVIDSAHNIGLKSVILTIYNGLKEYAETFFDSDEYIKIKKTIYLFIFLLKKEGNIFENYKLFDLLPDIIQLRFDEIYLGYDNIWTHNFNKTNLHKFRKSCKKLRYSFEFINPSFNNSLDNLLGYYKLIQDILGGIHDRFIWIDELSNIAAEQRDKNIFLSISKLKIRLKDEQENLLNQFTSMIDKNLNKTQFINILTDIKLKSISK